MLLIRTRLTAPETFLTPVSAPDCSRLHQTRMQDRPAGYSPQPESCEVRSPWTPRLETHPYLRAGYSKRAGSRSEERAELGCGSAGRQPRASDRQHSPTYGCRHRAWVQSNRARSGTVAQGCIAGSGPKRCVARSTLRSAPPLHASVRPTAPTHVPDSASVKFCH